MNELNNQFMKVYNFTPTPLEKAGGFLPIRIGRNQAKPNYHMGPKRTITSYSLHFVTEGAGVFQQENRTFPLRKGDLFCLFPNIDHQYYTDPQNRLSMFWIGFLGKQAIPLLNRIGLRPGSPHLPAIINEEVIHKLDRLFTSVRRPSGEPQDLIRVTLLFDLFQTLSALVPDKRRNAEDNAESWLKRGMDYLEMHFMEGISVDEAAKYVGVDRSHFSKLFRQKYGISPRQHLQQLAMKEAVRMVGKTECSISEIALSVGFGDVYAFSKAFKKFHGVSPTHFRRQVRAQPLHI
jgi:AraC-like DNA-binding protein